MSRTKRADEGPALQRTLAAFEAFEPRLMAAHVADFTALQITMAQAKLLYVVMSGGPLSVSEIATRLGISMSTASGAVDHLVQLEMLARAEEPKNRRQVRVSITPTGTRTIEQMRDLSARQLRALLERLDDKDLKVIERAIRIMTAALATLPKGPSQ
jgi:DNA-binding MarR family transcriptional regulator